MTRLCPACSAPLVRRQGEQRRNFEERKTCGHTCLAALRYPNSIDPASVLIEHGEALSQEDVAERLGVSRQLVQLIERSALAKLRRAVAQGGWL